jgi:hypothetical protein
VCENGSINTGFTVALIKTNFYTGLGSEGGPDFYLEEAKDGLTAACKGKIRKIFFKCWPGA